MAQKPNVLIFGGLNSLSPELALHLVPPAGEPLVGHLRIIDKFSIAPPTTYVGEEFPKVVQDRKDLIEYRQANLTVPETVAKCFTDPAPNGLPYSHVFDFSGDQTYERPSEVQVTQTLKVALGIAKEAAKHNTVKSYVRSMFPFYDQVTDSKKFKEDNPEGWKPLGVRGLWWHETLRAVANIPNLPLVILRLSYLYGGREPRGEVTKTMLLGLVYKHLDEEMKYLWSPKMKKNTAHAEDIVGALWACSQWAATMDRATANSIAGVSIPPSGDKEVKSVPEAVQKEAGGVVAPVFQITDDSDSTQESTSKVISNVFEIKSAFQGSLANQLAKMKFSEIVEDVNEVHMEEWTKIIINANPPVPSTPLTPYAQPYQLEKHGCALDNEKIKKILGYKLKYPTLNEDTVKQAIEIFRQEGIWPNTDKYPPA